MSKLVLNGMEVMDGAKVGGAAPSPDTFSPDSCTEGIFLNHHSLISELLFRLWWPHSIPTLCVYIYICMWYQCLSMKYDFISALTAVASNYKLCLILHHLILSFIPVFMLHIAVETKPAQLTLEFLAFQCYVLAAASALHGQHESSVLSLLIFSLPVPALLLPGFTWALEKGGIIGMRNKAELLFLTCLTPL